MAFEEIKDGLEKYCEETIEPQTDDVKVEYILDLLRKQTPRPPQNIVYDDEYCCFVCRCYGCGLAMYVDHSVNFCPNCGQAVLWDKVK